LPGNPAIIRTETEEMIKGLCSVFSEISAAKERIFKSEEADPHKQTVRGKRE
jgi:hypothetical protein